jgi:hypothetical protein
MKARERERENRLFLERSKIKRGEHAVIAYCQQIRGIEDRGRREIRLNKYRA